MLAGSILLSACDSGADPEGYVAVATRIRRAGPGAGIDGAALMRQLVRYATLAPSSHNTQCWKFRCEEHGIVILPDRSRRCPAVDPDDHHMFVSLGCATENLVHAASAYGFRADVSFDAMNGAVRVAFAPAPAAVSPLFAAISARQCTRGDYDGKPLANAELALLEKAGSSGSVRMLIMTDRTVMQSLLDYVVAANTAQMADAAFIRELKSWIRFNGPEAVRSGDGLFSVASGNPAIPTWLGRRAFGGFFRTQEENDKYVRQVRNSAALAVFVGQTAQKSSWVEVGRCYERFALQATALGIRNAFLNQPVEVPQVRSDFGAALGLADRRPDLVVRFGRGPALPSSLRRPVDAVLI